MEYYFCLDFLYIFLHYIHVGFTFSKMLFISLHFAKKKKTNEKRSGESRITACQTLWGQNQKLQKLNSLDRVGLA